MDTRVVTSHLPAELAEKLDGLAMRMDRPKGWVVKEAIASYVALEEERYQMTLEALEDVSAGRLHDHAEIKAWATSLGKTRAGRRK